MSELVYASETVAVAIRKYLPMEGKIGANQLG